MKQYFNYHTHTYRCNHARGDIDDYCQEAVKLQMKSLGFSDHTPLPNERWPNVRMHMDELAEYCEQIDLAKEKFPQLNIYKGLECEFDINLVNFYQDILLGKHKLEYLIGSVHWFPVGSTWLNSWRAPA
ncbi:MAG: PHP domain-containing protein, partial [Cyclobacteriaceae bacterium]|nr:PHP domain-containing protein [Cyclobacteriaceae bacterium]